MDEEPAGGKLDDARWHLRRYDSLEATMATKTSTVLSADALVLAGVTILVGQYFSRNQGATNALTVTVAAAGMASLSLVAVSVVATARALLGLRP